jgi:dTDP-4-dehydrorhamnose reductase
MTWLITGSGGQLGIALSQELRGQGLLFTSYNSLDLDVTNAPDVRKAISKTAPTVIVNCAAWTNVDGAESNEEMARRVNCDGAENLANAAKEIGAKFIQVSTDYVFSGEISIPRKVDDEVNPQTVYGRTKAEGENLVVRAYPEKSAIIRTAWLYSPWRKNFARTMTSLAMNSDRRVEVVIDQIGQPTSALDLANQIVNFGKLDFPAGIYHGTNSGAASWFEFAQEIFSLVGADLDRVIPIESGGDPRPAKRPKYSVLNHDAWLETQLKPMRNWRIALKQAVPKIIANLKMGE